MFYVGITRSEKFLFLTGSKNILGLKNRKSPSIFFHEYPNDYTITKFVKDPTQREEFDLSKAENLKGFPTSYSEIRYYDRCPYDYKIRFIYGFNPGIKMALGYGMAIHNILNTIHTEYKDKNPTRDEIFTIIEENFFLRFAPKRYIENLKGSAERIIESYVNRFSGEFNLVLETEKSFEFALGEALIAGNIDLIKKLNEKGDIEGIEIVDFKEHEDTEMATNYEKQLKLYAIASLRALGLNPKKATVHHLDEGTTSDIDISEDELKKIEDEIEIEVKDIMNRNFQKKPSRKSCKRCDWKYICTKMI